MTGRVHDEANRAIVGATVSVRAHHGSGAVESATDAMGEFAFHDLSEGEELEVSHPGYATRSFEIGSGASGRALRYDVLLVAGSWIAGTVIAADGSPIGGARVEADREREPAEEFMPGAESGTVESRADGEFELRGLRPGRFRILATAGSFAPAELRSVVLAADRGADGLRLVLIAGETLDGRVTGVNGELVTGALVRVAPAGSRFEALDPRYWGFEDFPVSFATTRRGFDGMVFTGTNAEGRFSLEGLPSGLVLVAVTARGWIERTLSGVPAGTKALEIRLTPAPQVRGCVIDATTTEPVRGFSVGGDRFDANDGCFEFRFSSSEARRIVVTATGYAPAYLGPFRLDEAAVVDVGTVPLRHGASIRGIVLDSRGRPMPAASGSLKAPDWLDTKSLGYDGFFVQTTNPDGTFVIANVPAGTWDLHLSTTGERAAAQRCTLLVPEGSELVDVTVPLVNAATVYTYDRVPTCASLVAPQAR